MAVEVRILRAGDALVLDRVADEVFDRPVDAALRSEFLGDPRHHLAVGIAERVVVGFASAVHYVHPDKPAQLWVNEVAVSPAWRRQGVATKILAALLALGRDLGCSEAWVLTDGANTAARELYKAAGGIEDGPIIMVTFPLSR